MNNTARQRLAEAVNQTREINLSKEDKDNGSAILHITSIDNNLSVHIDGTLSSIANMMFNAACQYPAFKEIIKNIASEL